jgi:V/A-type H+-transporting ATPase subunit G/H
MSVEDIRSLVNKEKKIEEEIQRAKDAAANILEKAKTEARRILGEAEDSKYYDALLEKEEKVIGEKKKSLEKEYNNSLEELRKIANSNMERTIAFIIEKVLEG